MGLDMYLEKRTYVKNWSHTPSEKKVDIKVTIDGIEYPDIDTQTISHIVNEVAYWRKFNALHNWFITHCGGGEDDGRDIYISQEALEELHRILTEVKELLKDKILVENGEFADCYKYLNTEQIREIFPPSPGFFFGLQEIDSYYENNVIETLKILDDILKTKDEYGALKSDYYYKASW